MKKCKRCGEFKPLTEYYKHLSNTDGLYGSCRTCYIKKGNKQKSGLIPFLKKCYRHVNYRKSDKIILKGAVANRLNLTEARHDCKITWDDFLKKFKSQHSQLGLTCPIFNIRMTHQLGKGRLMTNISVDRLDNDLPYTYENIIFISDGANMAKGPLRFPDIIALNFWLKQLMPHKYYGYTKELELRLEKLADEAKQRRIENEMEQAIQLSENREGTHWEQTSLFD